MGDAHSVESFNRIADRYDRHWGQFGCRRADPEVLAAAGPHQPGRVLDVGCGTGRLLRLAAERWPDADLIGVDPAAEMIRVARGKLPRATLLVAGAELLPCDDASIDLVLSTTAFGHWADQSAGLREIARVLTPTGTLVLAEHTPPPRWLRPVVKVLGEPPAHRTESELRALLAGAGLRVRAAKRVSGGLLLITADLG
ncbi:methyltransferase domain-containing protein [Micromonospora sp. NPDC007271]|uniref:class I SAM-dependent methyltransferase n=1 Tax=Micromonospora sp. NPDC007271 TaxID=3154587 RepID=UPI0033CFD8B5